MALYFNILSIILLALVAGLLLVLHFQLKEWRAAAREAPLLAEKLAEALLTARKGLADLKHELTAQGPDLHHLLDEGGKLRVELQFLMQRAEQVAVKLEGTQRRTVQPADEDEDLPAVRLSPDVQAVVERVAGANGMAAKPAAKPAGYGAAGDPLEELLANLHAHADVANTPLDKNPRRKRSGPVTQAELDLQQSLKGGA